MWALIAVVALGTAALLAPGRVGVPSESTPPPEAVVRAVALGRNFAASDVIWLQTVQLMGDPLAEQRRWPSLEGWVDLTTRLDPTFESPYFFGTTLLVSDATRAEVVDHMLDRGQRALPNSYYFPMMRGYIAYFSRLDPAAAAVHYHAAARLPNGPRILEDLATRLETRALSCPEMLRDLTALAVEETPEKRRALLAEREPIIISCVAAQLKNATGAFRLREGRDGSIEDLRAAGLVIGELYTPAGKCWSLAGGIPALVACPTERSPP